MIETTDLKVIEAIDNIRNTVGDIFEEDHCHMERYACRRDGPLRYGHGKS